MSDLGPDLTLVIPAFNEAESLPTFLPQLLEYGSARNWNIIIVNDGSTDRTKEVLHNYARDDRLTVIHHKVNKGYGAALKTGIRAVQTELLVTIDADGQHLPQDIEQLLDLMVSEEIDMVVGSRKGLKSHNPLRSSGKWLIRGIAKILLPIPIYDINSGMKMYRTDLAQKYIDLCPDSMAFSDIITLTFVSQKHLVRELPINIRERIAGESTIGVQTAFETLLEIVNIVMLFNPLKIFFPVSIFLIVVGVALTLPPLFAERGVSVGGSLMIIVGFANILLGLMAEQLSLIRKDRVK